MKPIKLTEEHKSKLLEMCKILFPEYLLIDIHKNGLLVLWEELPPSRMWNEIHWFEFCMTHLASKIIYSLYIPKNANSDEGGQIGMDKFNNTVLYYPKKHPIDYLYFEFQQLNIKPKCEIFEKLKVIIQDKITLDDCCITLESDLRVDLGFDSLDAVELLMEIERDFNIHIRDEDVSSKNEIYVFEIVEYIKNKLK